MQKFFSRSTMPFPLVLWLGWILIYAIISAIYPRDASYDVAHYHLHNGWSALHHRFAQDLAPAELHSFLNPTYNIAVWWLIERLPGWAVSAILGAVQATLLPLAYLLGVRLLKLANVPQASVSALICAAVGFFCVPVLATMSSIRNDSLGAIFFILSILLLVRPGQSLPGVRVLALAAFIAGLSCGMKLTNIVYVAGFAVFVIVLFPGWVDRSKAVLVAGFAGLAGMLLTGGWWMMILYGEFSNPVFPLMNNLFAAPLGPADVFRDERYLPQGVIDGLLTPVISSFRIEEINEGNGRDLRLFAAYLGSLAVLGVSIFLKFRQTSVPRPLVAFASAMLAFILFWVLQFSIMRYASAAFVLGPLLLFLAISMSGLSRLKYLSGRPALYGLAMVFVLSTEPESVRRIAWTDFNEPYIDVVIPDDFDVENAGIIMAGPFPTSFTAFAFDKSAWMTHGDVQEWSEPFLRNYRPLIKTRIEETSGPLYAVICLQEESSMTPEMLEENVNWESTPDQTIGRLQSELPIDGNPDDCKPLKTSFDTIYTSWLICPLVRTDIVN